MQCWIYGSFPMKSGDFLQLKADLLGFNVKAVTCALNIQNLDGIQWVNTATAMTSFPFCRIIFLR